MVAAVTIDLTDVQTLIVGAAALVVAWGVLWRGLVKPVHKRVRVMHDIIERELMPNGGSSVKDATTKAADAVGEAVAAARRAEVTAAALKDQVAEVQGSQETIFELFDNVVSTKGREHEEMWEALRTLGVDRRRDARRETDPPPEGAL